MCIFYVLFSCKIIIFDNSTKHPSRHDSQSGDGTEGSQSQRKKLSPPSAAFVVLLLLVIWSQKRNSGQILLLSPDASQQDETVDFAIDPWAPALLYCDLNVPVILDEKMTSYRRLRLRRQTLTLTFWEDCRLQTASVISPVWVEEGQDKRRNQRIKWRNNIKNYRKQEEDRVGFHFLPPKKPVSSSDHTKEHGQGWILPASALTGLLGPRESMRAARTDKCELLEIQTGVRTSS